MEKDFIKRIVVDPKIMVGKPIIKGTRITVYEIVRRVSNGQTFKEIEEDLEISGDDIKAALMYAGKLVEGEEIYRPSAACRTRRCFRKGLDYISR